MTERSGRVESREKTGRSLPSLAVKASVTIALVWWLLRSGALEVSRVGILIGSPRVFLVTVATWITMTAVLSTLRWWVLLDGVGYPLRFGRALALQLMALFFNGLVPGNIGGDLLKNHAVVGKKGGRLVVLVLVERTIGLIALIWVAAIGVIPSIGHFGGTSPMSALVYLVLLLMTGSVVAPWLLLRIRLDKKIQSRLASPSSVGAWGSIRTGMLRIMNSALVSLEMVKGAKRQVVVAFFVSLTMHVGNTSYFLFLTRALGNSSAGIADAALIFPVGMLSVVIPVSISGLGVGHVMFNELFSIVGLMGGANVFNVYIVAQIAPCLVGAIPYLMLRSQLPEEDAEVPSAR
jgi:uncharacterized protein (TIRG00374 family)